MFDEPINTNPAGVPNNLPVGEPEDMFAGVKDESVDLSGKMLGNSALSAGVLTPKNPVVGEGIPVVPAANKPPVFSTMPEVDAPPVVKTSENYVLKEPVVTRVITTLLVVVLVLGGVLALGWWLYGKYFNKNQTVVTTETTTNTEQSANQTENNNATTGTVSDTNNDVSAKVADDQVLFGEPIDTDNDGLPDDEEIKLGTDPKNWDTDGDTLGDGDEVLIWKTDPLNPDTDGDGYKDGEEVKNGYNPKGSGKIFELPTVDNATTSTDVATTTL